MKAPALLIPISTPAAPPPEVSGRGLLVALIVTVTFLMVSSIRSFAVSADGPTDTVTSNGPATVHSTIFGSLEPAMEEAAAQGSTGGVSTIFGEGIFGANGRGFTPGPDTTTVQTSQGSGTILGDVTIVTDPVRHYETKAVPLAMHGTDSGLTFRMVDARMNTRPLPPIYNTAPADRVEIEVIDWHSLAAGEQPDNEALTDIAPTFWQLDSFVFNSSSSLQIITVPEPGRMSLTLLGLALLVLRRRR